MSTRDGYYKGWYIFYHFRKGGIWARKGEREIGPFKIRDEAKEWVNQQRDTNPRKSKRKKKTVITTKTTVRTVRKTNRRRKRRSNPRMFMLVAQRVGQKPLKYVGNKFARTGRAVLFSTRASALTIARFLRLQYPALKRYTLRAV